MSRIKKHGIMVGGVMLPTAAVVAVLLWAHKVEERLTIIETQHTAMMESIKQSSDSDRIIMEDIKDLMKEMINGGGHTHD